MEVPKLVFSLDVETVCKWTILLAFRNNVLSSSSGLETVRWNYFRVICRWTLISKAGSRNVSYWGPRAGAPGIVRKWAYKGLGVCRRQPDRMNVLRPHSIQVKSTREPDVRIWHSEDRASWYILILEVKENHYFWNLFDKVLYMFRTFVHVFTVHHYHFHF
jgi:hypothetical protein